jgi:hypothetical protein
MSADLLRRWRTKEAKIGRKLPQAAANAQLGYFDLQCYGYARAASIAASSVPRGQRLRLS